MKDTRFLPFLLGLIVLPAFASQRISRTLQKTSQEQQAHQLKARMHPDDKQSQAINLIVKGWPDRHINTATEIDLDGLSFLRIRVLKELENPERDFDAKGIRMVDQAWNAIKGAYKGDLKNGKPRSNARFIIAGNLAALRGFPSRFDGDDAILALFVGTESRGSHSSHGRLYVAEEKNGSRQSHEITPEYLADHPEVERLADDAIALKERDLDRTEFRSLVFHNGGAPDDSPLTISVKKSIPTR